MAVRVTKIDAAAAVPIIELTIAEVPRCAAVRQLRLANAAQDGIELGITNVECIVVALELLVVVEKECECIVDTYRCEMAAFRIGMEAKNARKKSAAALLSWAGTMVWLRVIVIGKPFVTRCRRRIARSKP